MARRSGYRSILAALIAVGFIAIAAAVMGTPSATLTVKLAPTAVSVDTAALAPKEAQAAEEEAWRLFDTDTTSSYLPLETTRVAVSLSATATVNRIRIYGASSYVLNVYRRVGDTSEPIPSLTAIDLTKLGQGWNTISAAEAFDASQLILEFVPQGNATAGIREIEIWGPEAATGNESQSQLTLDGIKTPQDMSALLKKSPSHIIDIPATPTEAPVSEGSTATVTIKISQNRALIKRAYLLYDGYNLVRSVSIERRVNRLSWAGGFAIPQPEDAKPAWSSYLEEISPAWLTQGENRIEFRTVSGQATIRNLRLIIETDSGWNAVSTVGAASAYDGNIATAYEITASSINPFLEIDFDRIVQPDTLRLNVSGPAGVKANLQYRNGSAWQDVKTDWNIDMSALQGGWNEIQLPAPVTTDALRLVFNTSVLRIKPGVRVGAINELRVSSSPVGAPSSVPRIVVSYPRDGEYFGRTAYLQGFATPATNQAGNAGWVSVEGKDAQRTIPDGSFSISLSKDDTRFYDQADDDTWQPVVTSLYGGQTGASQGVLLNKNSGSASQNGPDKESRGNAAFPDAREHHTEKVSPGQAKKIQYGGVTLDIPAGAVDVDTDITIVPLNEADLAHYDPGMINVTYPAAGYRFLPHGIKFKKAITISFGYAKQLLAAGQTDNDVNMYYYDETLLRWQPLTRVKVDTAASQVASLSDHFTDIINSTLVTPEHPQALSFNPNSIKDIKAADPSANVNLIEPPKANSKGTANLSYPIEVPPGRNQIQPNLAVQYNSSGGNGWMGLGWDLPLQAISIDTRWGVPRYDMDNETETYTLDGEQLTPLAHRSIPVKRTSEKVFHTRVEGAFRKIVRHGTDPTNYSWEVTDKNGTKYIYGDTPEATLVGSNGIFKWALHQVRDTNGNTMTYSYVTVANKGIADGNVMGYQLYLKQIDYTGHDSDPGAYSVVFTRDRDLQDFTQRPDVTIDARSGAKTVTADLLKRIDVWFQGSQRVRSYVFGYTEGAFRKTLLQAISQYGTKNTLFNKHEFSYYNNVKVNDTLYDGFNPATDWNTQTDSLGFDFLGLRFDASALGSSESTNFGGSIFVGYSPMATKYISAGLKKGMNGSRSEGLIALVDINGDGLPDKVFKCGNNVCYHLNTSGPHAGTSYISFERDPILIKGISRLSWEQSNQSSFGPQGFAYGVSALYDTSQTITTQSIYFSDVNGDGLVDMVAGGIVLFNHLDQHGNPVFTPDSNDTPAPIGPSSVNVDGMLPDFSQQYQEMIDQNPLLDSVRRWVAPYDGTVSISGGVQLVDTTQDRLNDDYTTADGVRVAVQKEGGELWTATIDGTDFSIHGPSGLDNISVRRGDRIYFRVQSLFDGSYDQVQWNPTISYVGEPVEQTDVNSLPVYRFTAADDMVYGGREFDIPLPFRGKLRISGDLVKKGITTDDVTVSIALNGTEIRRTTLAWDRTGTITPSVNDIDVQYKDVLTMKVLVDSDIDQRQIEWKPQVFYVEAYYPDITPLDPDGNPAKDEDGNPAGPAPGSPVTVQDDKGNYTVQIKPLYDVDFYPATGLTAPQISTTATTTGTMLVTPFITPLSSSTDTSGFSFDADAIFTVKRRNVRLGKNDITIVQGEAYDEHKHSFEISVNAGDELFLDFSTRMTDLEGKIQGVSATAHYIVPTLTATVDNVPLSSPSGTTASAQIWVSSMTGTATITPSVATKDGSAFDLDSSLTLNVVVSHSESDGQGGQKTFVTSYSRDIAVVKGQTVDPAAYAFDVPVVAGDSVSFSYRTADPALAGKAPVTGVVVRISTGTPPMDMPAVLHSNAVAGPFSKPYRGWGYIAYDGNRDRATEPIDQNRLKLTVDPNNYDLSDPQSAASIPITFYHAIPDAAQERWASADQHWWIAPASMSSARLGLQYISVPTADKFNGKTAVPRITQSSQRSFGAGFYIAFSAPNSQSHAVLDYMDLNGDGYPDVVAPGAVLYTDMLGEFAGKGVSANFGEINSSETHATTIGPGGTVPDAPNPSDKKPPAKPDSQNPSYGLSGSLGRSTSEGHCQMIDMNGDGLPDSVCEFNGVITVQLNLGYHFAPAEIWGSAMLSNGTSINASVSLSYSDGVKGFAGGPSVSADKMQNGFTLADMNGDGLPDRIFNDGNNIWVGFNTGSGFATPALWTGNLGHKVNENLVGSLGLGVSYYVAIPILPPLPITIIINPEVNGGTSLSREESTLRDVKGDGAADQLYSNSDGSMRVAANRTENTNLLKTVKRPLGGKIELEYQREGNTTDMPQSEWTLSKTTLTDGRGNSYVTATTYKDGYKDRYEREFYGFKTVTETQAPGTPISRTVTQTFNNRDYYQKGLLLKSVTTDLIGRGWARTDNTYTLFPVSGYDHTEFPALTRTDTYFYDGTTDGEDGYKKSTYQTFGYDSYGNVTSFFDAGEVFTADDDVSAIITPFIDADAYIMKPGDIKVYGPNNSTPLRWREAIYSPGTGNLKQLTLHNTGTGNAVWKMTYDTYGNIQTIADPVGYVLTYGYDPETSTYVTLITDNFSGGDGGPYYSSASYNLLFGQVRSSVDLNGNVESRGYDEFGRLGCVYGPYDAAPADPDSCSSPATVAFSYAPPAVSSDDNALTAPAGAITFNRAVSSKGSSPIVIKTATYGDGMKRIIETKKDADVNGSYGMTVSGLVVFDALGRVVVQGQPVFAQGFSPAFVQQAAAKNPTLFAYDTLDRTTIVQTPDANAPGGDATTTTAYSFGQVKNSGDLYAATVVVDPEGNKVGGANRRGTKVSYKDVHDRIMAVVEFNSGSPITTQYAYDPLGQIRGVVDDKGNTTVVDYDQVGNRTLIDNPDTGATRYGYDANGNLVSKQNANSQKVSYHYVFNRLTDITYPQTPTVHYDYGVMREANNRAGRIKKVTNESGTEERFYNRLGETAREVRTVQAHTPSVQSKSFTTDYVFDSFGRMWEMTYPDGEVLHYAYDNGGLLKAAWGEKSGNRYDYVTSLLYDEYGQRTHIEYGNRTKTDYAYDQLTRRLSKLNTKLPDGREIQKLSYTYDLVGNVLSLGNNILLATNTALPAGPVNQKFGYDDLYQLVNGDGGYSFGPGKQNTYSNTFGYDTIGNMTRKLQVNQIIQPSSTTTLPKQTNYVLGYVYGGTHPHAVTDDGTKTYSYDPAGNMKGWQSKTSGQKRTIIWNEENRVKEIDDNGKATYFLYDDQGERVEKRGQYGETIYVNRFYSVKNGELGTKNVFAGETRVLSKLVKTPNTVTTNSGTVPGSNGLNHGIGKKRGIIRRLPDGTATGITPPLENDEFFYHGDHLGSSNMITDSYGQVYQHLEYFPYGESWIEEGGNSSFTPGYKFTGKELDPETGLYYYGARYYDPVLSRWISADPIIGKYLPNADKADKESNDALAGNGGVYNPINLALYAYAHQNPVKLMDPDGKDVLVPVAARLSNKNDISYWRAQKDPYTVYEYNVYDYNTPQEYVAAERAGTLTDPIGSVELSFDARMKGDNKGTILGSEGKWAEMQNRHTQYGEKTKHAISLTDVGKGKEDIFTTKKGSSLINKLLNKIGLGTPETGDVRKNIRAHAGGPYGSKGCATSCDPSMNKAGFEAELGKQIPSLGSKDEKTFIWIPAKPTD